jgi:AraC-like DNA-binding protein
LAIQCNGGRRIDPHHVVMTAPLLYFELEPPRELAEVVLAFWGFEVRDGAPAVHTLWPDASASLTWGMYGGRTIVATVTGARTKPVAVPVQPGVAFRGIRWWPDAAAHCGIDPRRARDGRVALEELGELGARFEAAMQDATSLTDAFAIFETALLPSLENAGTIDPLVRRALLRIDAAPDRAIADLARELRTSDRQLRRRFGDATGLAPKEYARIRRLRHTLGRVMHDDDSRWSTIAAQSGFADQPHLVNEIVRMTAFTPTMLEQRLRLIEHVGVRP